MLDRACIHHPTGHHLLGVLVLVNLPAEPAGTKQVDRRQVPRGEDGTVDAGRCRAPRKVVDVLLALGRRFAHQGRRTASGGGCILMRRRWRYWGQRAILEGAQLREKERRGSSWPCRSHPARFLVRIDTWKREENNQIMMKT